MATPACIIGRMTKLAISNSRSLSTCSNTSLISRSVVSSATSATPSASFLQAHTNPHISISSRLINRSLATASVAPRSTKENSVLATGPDGTQYLIPRQPLGLYAQKRHSPKIAPRIVSRRVSKLKVTEGKLRAIRHSPWRMNLVCQFAAGQTVIDALTQLKFCEKAKAPDVTDLIYTTAAQAKVRHGLLPCQLEVAECFATHGTHLKRIKIMGRGRAGKKHRRHSHVKLVLREIDYPLKIMQATSTRERNGWIQRMNAAMLEVEVATKEKEEVDKLEQEYEAVQRKKAAENEKK